MNQPGTVDLAALFWDPAAFDANAYSHYAIATTLQVAFGAFTANEASILFRDELQSQLWSSFPLNDKRFNDLVTSINLFISANPRQNIIRYKTEHIADMTHTPSVGRDHFGAGVSDESNSILAHLFNEGTDETVFYTLKSLWRGKSKVLSLKRPGKATVRVEAILLDEDNTLDEYFARKERVFDPSPKHTAIKARRVNKGKIASKLSCMKGDKQGVKCQALLDNAYRVSRNRLYAWDEDNRVYVVFARTERNVYHGYDEETVTEIPAKIRKSLGGD